MNNNIKNNRIIGLIAAFLAVMLCSIVFLGCGSVQDSVTINEQEGGVVELTIYAFNGDSERSFLCLNMGHSFIAVTNNSDENIMVGALEVESGQSASIGTWGQSAHWGVWYNLESEYMSIGRYEGISSITQDITLSQVDDLTTYIAENDYWKFTKNCSYFAVEIWNSVSDESEQINFSSVATPGEIVTILSNSLGYETDKPIENYGKVGYAVGGDADAFVEFTMEAI